jgi:hypothetical protein
MITHWPSHLQSWHNADYEKPPLGGKFFCPQDRITSRNTLAAPATPAPQTPQPLPGPQCSYMYPPPPGYPLSMQNPPTYYPPITPYHAPYGMAPGYSAVPPNPFGYSPTPNSTSTQQAVGSSSSLTLSARLTTVEWCHKHGLDDKECRGLDWLGFRAGDKLDMLSDDVWQWANLRPLHKQRILCAYQTEQAWALSWTFFIDSHLIYHWIIPLFTITSNVDVDTLLYTKYKLILICITGIRSLETNPEPSQP